MSIRQQPDPAAVSPHAEAPSTAAVKPAPNVGQRRPLCGEDLNILVAMAAFVTMVCALVALAADRLFGLGGMLVVGPLAFVGVLVILVLFVACKKE